jgi:glycerophosphoryl diester phosphodiesterase
MTRAFDLQGHRGARGLKPENTLPSFEAAFDLGVSSVETDVHLSRDGVPVLFHDTRVTDRLCRRGPGAGPPFPCHRPPLSSLSLEQVRRFIADRNPDGKRFPALNAAVTPLAALFARQQNIEPYAPPALADLFAFAAAYAGEPGARAGKTDEQRDRARRVRFDLELKRVPFHPETIGDHFDGTGPGLLEQRVVELVRAADLVDRVAVRSFDHRAVRAARQLEPRLAGQVLVADTVPADPVQVARAAGAGVYCPGYRFLDAGLVRHLQAEGIRVLPWTVNEPPAWERLLGWGVDGLTTDFPDQLAEFLRACGLAF